MRTKTWKVTLYQNDWQLGQVLVEAPTRLFAKWAAKEVVGWKLWQLADRVTLSTTKKAR